MCCAPLTGLPTPRRGTVRSTLPIPRASCGTGDIPSRPGGSDGNWPLPPDMLVIFPTALQRILEVIQSNLTVALNVDHQLVYPLLRHWLMAVQAGNLIFRMGDRAQVRSLPRLQIGPHDVADAAELWIVVVLLENRGTYAAYHQSRQNSDYYNPSPRYASEAIPLLCPLAGP